MKTKDFIILCLLGVLLVAANSALHTVQIAGWTGTSNPTLRADSSTHTLQVITNEHHEIHDGSMFFFTEVNTLDDTDTREYLLEVGNKEAHLEWRILGKYDTQIDFYETTTKTTGTGISEINENRNSTNVNTTVATHTPGGAGDGTLIHTFRGGDDTTPSGSGGAQFNANRENEIDLATNTDYLLRITSHTDANVISSKLSWYEHTPKE